MIRSALALILSVSIGQGALAASCGPRLEIADELRTKHDEEPIGVGYQKGRGAITLWRSADGGFTLTFRPERRPFLLCLMATGKNWEVLQPVSSKGNAL